MSRAATLVSMDSRSAPPQVIPERRAPTSQPELPPQLNEDLRTYVTISRNHQDDVRHRQVVVRLDDQPKALLLFGDSFTQQVQPGTHRLHAHNTLFWKTVKFTVEPGEHLEFVVINKAGP